MSEELKGNGHCETLVVDDEPTEGASGDAQAALCARAPVGLHPSLPVTVLLLLQSNRTRARQ
jgi:hypothetical protein